MKLPKLNIIPWYIKLAVPVGGVVLLIVILLNWWANVKTNITHTHPDYVAAQWSLHLCDSLQHVSERNLLAASKDLLQKDSTIAAYKSREAQHQVNNYELSKQLNTYRRQNRVCYKTNFWGKTEEVPCSEVFK